MVLDTLTNIVQQTAAAIIALLIGFILAKLIGRFAKRVFAEAELNRMFTAAGFNIMGDTLARFVEYTIYVITILVALQQLGLTELVIGILQDHNGGLCYWIQCEPANRHLNRIALFHHALLI